MEAGDQRGHGVQGVLDAAAVPPGVQVLGGAAQRELQRRQAPGTDRQRGDRSAPHAAVGAQHEVSLQDFFLSFYQLVEVGAADLFLAFKQKLDVDGQAPQHREASIHRLHRDQQRPLVVADAAPVDAPTHNGGRERRRAPFLQRLGRLHVVVAVDQDGGRVFASFQMVGVNGGMSGGGPGFDGVEACFFQTLCQPLCRPRHVRGVLELGADAGNGGEGQQVSQGGLAALLQRVQHLIQAVYHLPPSTLSTCPVIHPACSEAKNSTALAMSSGVPRRLSAMPSTSLRWPSSP